MRKSSSPKSLTDRIQGTPGVRILREFVTNSGLYPLFEAIRFMTENGVQAYVVELPHYIILASAGVQSWFLGRRAAYTWWERAAGNLIAPTLYTVVDMIVEGPAAFVAAPQHWIYWTFSLGLALLSLAQVRLPRVERLFVIAANLWRVLLFPALYVVAELGTELKGVSGGTDFLSYWNSTPGHNFILLAALLFGLLLGLSESEVTRYTAYLRRVARRLKQFSEWSLDAGLLEESVEDLSALRQRRAERTILFMDIRGFTRWSEDKDPETVIGMLNEFYEKAERIIAGGGGHKPHFIADEVMSWFEDPMQAVETARALRGEVSALLMRYQLDSGSGLHLGPVVEGLMGSSGTRSYNIIGDTVNTSARLCAAAGPGEVLVSETLARRLDLVPKLGASRAIQAKGKQEPVIVYPL